MAFTYYPNESVATEPGLENLRNNYFVQLAPDKKHLVNGMLQQGKGGAVGQWLNVTAIDRIFPERYFVQLTDFNTLVPGSLVQATRHPKGHWKELKMPASTDYLNFHRVVFDSGYLVATTGSPIEFSSVMSFVNDYFFPVMDLLFPDYIWNGTQANAYFFKGNFAELMEDTTQMQPFGEGALLWIYFAYANFIMSNINTGIQMGEQMLISSDASDGMYSIILEVTEPAIGQFIVMENILEKYTPAGE